MIAKRISFIILSLLFLVTVSTYILITKNSGLRGLVWVTELTIPGKLQVERVKGSLWEGGHFSHITYDNKKVNVQLNELSFRIRPLDLLWSQVHFSELMAKGLQLTLKPNQDSTPVDLNTLSFPVNLHAPTVELDDIAIKKPAATTATIVNKITADLSVHGTALKITDMNVVAPAYHVGGELLLSPRNSQPLTLSLKSQGDWHNNPWQGELTLHGNLENMRGQLAALFPKNAIWRQVIATVSLKKATDKWLLQNLTITRVKENKASNVPTVVDAQDGVLSVSGSIPFAETDPIRLNGNWQHVLLPTLKDKTIEMTEGNFTLTGTKEQYTVNATGIMRLSDKIIAQIGLVGQGDLNGIQLNKISIKPQSTANRMGVTGTAAVHWAPTLAWQLDTQVTSIDPELIAPTLPGAINLNASSVGSVQNEKINATVKIDHIQGQLNHQPVNGNIALSIKNNALSVDDFKLLLADNQMKVEGNVADDIDLTWQINAPHLEHFLSTAKGSLISTGKLNGTWATPQVTASVTAQKVTLPQLTLDKLEGKANINFAESGIFNVALQANNLQYERYHVDSAVLTGQGRRDAHQMTLSLKRDKDTLIVKTNGGWHAGYWHGDLTELTAETQALDNWHLQNKVPLIAGSDKFILLAPLCFAGNKTCIQAAWQKEKNSYVKVNSVRLPLSLLKLWLPTNVSLKGDSELHFFWQQDVKKGIQTQGSWRILPGLLTVQYEKNISQVFSYRGGTINTSLRNNNIVANANVELWRQMRAIGNLTITNALHKTIWSQPVEGNFVITVPDLQWLQHWNQDIHNVKGQLQTDLKMTGTLSQPVLEGKAELKEGSVEIPRRGITFNHIKMLIKSNAAKQFQIAAEATSGPGQLTVSGRAGLAKGNWILQTNIEGNNVQLANTPEADILASPKLTLSYSNSLWKLAGKVFLPRAIIKPRLFVSAVHVSNDVVVTTPAPEEANKKMALPLLISADIELVLGKQVHFEGFNLSTDVTGTLRIIHEPKQITRGIGILRAKKGEYTAYGKILTVQSGQLIYNGNAIDDPGFEIRAERTIDVLSTSQSPETMPNGMQIDKNSLPQISPDKSFPDLSNVQTGTVGVVGSGTLKKPRFRLFSNPTMPETDILSYLLIGVPTSQASAAQGQILFQALNQMSSSLGPGDSNRFMNLLKSKFGLDDVHLQTSTYLNKTTNKSESQTSVVLGKALSPHLFINYTIGLLDPVNIVQITYKLTRSWSVQTDANNRGSSGGDIVYSIERN